MNNTFKRILVYAKPYSKFAPKYIAIMIPAMIFGILNFVAIIPLLDVIFEPDKYTAVEVPAFALNGEYFSALFNNLIYQITETYGNYSTLIFVAILLIVASFLANFFKYWGQRVLAKMRTYVMRGIRKDLFDKITRLHVGYFNDQRKGNLLSSMSNDVTEVQNTVVTSFQVIFKDPILIIGNLFALFYISPHLTIIALLALPFSGWAISRIAKKLKRKAREVQNLQGDILSVTEETVSGARIVKAFNAQKHENERFDNLNVKHATASKKMFYRQEMASPLSEFLGVTAAAIVLLCAGYFIFSGDLDMSSSTLIAYFALYYNVLTPVKEVSKAYNNVQRGMAAAERIFEIVDTPVPIKKAENAISINEFSNSIEFKNVSFKYEMEPVLKNINLTIPKGKMYALVGHSGAGKSTIADLIPRFYDVTSGEICIDGNDIKQLQPNDLIALMGIVTQEAILFNDSVLNNIAFGVDNVREEDVIEAAKIANAHEFIVNLDNGYYTNIGDRGGKLSGGQRQRLAIARAVFKNPPILILDEATSALDTESERLVQDALANLMKNRTSIVIAHRLSTIRHADQIVVIDKGCIVEQGTHDELTAKDGIYKYLCGLQLLDK